MISSVSSNFITLNGTPVRAVIGTDGEFYLTMQDVVTLLLPEWNTQPESLKKADKIFKSLRILGYTTALVVIQDVLSVAITLENFNKVLWHLVRKGNPHAIAIADDAKTTPIRMLFIDTMPTIASF